VGSIGVVTQIPNFQRFLNKQEIDAYLVTSGKYKRTIDIIGDVTEEGKEKLQEELDAMHHAFQDHIGLARPQLKEVMDSVATGEYWLAVHAKEKGLVDEIMTSDEYLESLHYDKQYDIIQILEKKKRSILSATLFPSSLLNFKSTITEGLSAFAAKQHQQKPRPMAIH
jgi:serine protease SohB